VMLVVNENTFSLRQGGCVRTWYHRRNSMLSFS
jgi:hypothetical protein